MGWRTEDPRETKLPRWAQELIADLRRQVQEEAEKAEAALLAVPADDSDAVLDRYTYQIGLGKDPMVKFNIGKSNVLTIRGGDGRLRVVAQRGSLDVRPEVSNVITIGVVTR